MSSSEFWRNAAISESNIPVPRRTGGARKATGCAQLPELQRYIDTILKTSSECDAEDASVSERPDRSPKEKKFRKCSVNKGNDNRANHEKVKFDFRVTACKNKSKTKTPFTEAVSNGDEIANKFVKDFEDPRNWKTDHTQNRGSKSEIENFIKKLFPNPYHLENISEFPTVNSDIIPEKKEEDDLGDVTLADLPKSNAHTQNEVDYEKTDNAFLTAYGEIEPCARETNTNCNTSRPACLETSSLSKEGRNNADSKSTTPLASKRKPTEKSTISTISTRCSSLDSLSDIFSNPSQAVTLEEYDFAVKSSLISKDGSNEPKLRSSVENFLEETASDYDLGKLKLLSMTDSEDSFSKNSDIKRVKNATADHVGRTIEDVFESDDLSDLKQIFDVMNKATESFVILSSKTGYNAQFDITDSYNDDNEKLLDFLNDLTAATDPTLNNDDRHLHQYAFGYEENDNYSIIQQETKLEGTTTKNPVREFPFENSQEKAATTAKSSSMTFTLTEEKFDLTKSPEENSSDETGLWNNNSAYEVRRTAGNDKNRETGENLEATQAIDEVLEFMYKCLKKFGDQHKNLSEAKENSLLEDQKETKTSTKSHDDVADEKANTPTLSVKNTPSDKDATESFSSKSPCAKEIQGESSTSLDGAKKKSITRIRCKRKNENSPPTQGGRPQSATTSFEVRSTADAAGVNCNNRVHTVETHNELGSYTEQAQVSSVESSPKSFPPLSVKLKKSKTDTQKTIKDVLETEEKLLASQLKLKSPEKKTPEKAGELKPRKPQNNVVLRSGKTATANPFFNDFKRSNSNFVICVSSLPRNLRTMANRTSLSLSPALSLSVSDVSKSWDLKPLPYYHKLPLKKVPVVFEIARSVCELTYNVKQGAVLRVNKSMVAHVARPVCVKAIVGTSRLEEFSLKDSECFATVKVRPIKKSLFVESSTVSLLTRPGIRSRTNCGIDAEMEGSQRVETLLEALERTEGRLLLLENSSDRTENVQSTSESLSSSSANDVAKCEHSELDLTGESGHTKIHDLLLRTYNLQHKLHQYLQKITCAQATPISSLKQQEQCSGCDVIVKNLIGLDSRLSSFPFHWCVHLPGQSRATSVEVQTKDHATSYCPPSEEIKQTCQNTKISEAENLDNDNGEDNSDGSSSVCSFKSSNDFSEVPNPEEESKPSENSIKNEMLKKIFNEIESFKQSFAAGKKPNTHTDDTPSVNSNFQNVETLKENKLVEYDPKTPAKVLKTVFKGKKSMTELTIGLKDVPMTKVSNISVEKRKFSPNHTKISICILKEKPDHRESLLHNKPFTFYTDHIRPPLTDYQKESSLMEDDFSKTSDTANESSDEDDFKSVASTLSNQDVTGEENKTTDDTRKPDPPPPKTFTKYRFDFYRKMDMNLDARRPKPKLPTTLCPYKELEPLKQALTEMQIRMRSIKHNTFFSSDDYYERALKLAKMSAGYCQSCGTRAVIPKDTSGYYRTLLPRRCSSQRHARHFKITPTLNPSFHSFRSTNQELGGNVCDLDIKHSSSYLLNHRTHSKGTFLQSSLYDMPILVERT